MNDGLIPRRYAKALYKFACESEAQKRVYGVMCALAESFKAQPELQQVLGNPFVSVDDKVRLLNTASCAKKSDREFADFVQLLVENRRIDMARDIALSYLDIYRQENNIYVVKVTSAAPMATDAEKRLKSIVERHLGAASMEYTSVVDPQLIGGFRVEVGNELIDASISNELKQMRFNLLSK